MWGPIVARNASVLGDMFLGVVIFVVVSFFRKQLTRLSLDVSPSDSTRSFSRFNASRLWIGYLADHSSNVSGDMSRQLRSKLWLTMNSDVKAARGLRVEETWRHFITADTHCSVHGTYEVLTGDRWQVREQSKYFSSCCVRHFASQSEVNTPYALSVVNIQLKASFGEPVNRLVLNKNLGHSGFNSHGTVLGGS
uniref:Uncharacterized protein n=1 Tax=Riboviria sp. TaxID=2585031 RepID=A0A8K1U2E2_9VIRU|nr:MAG: hypothetical protein 2 [Riboviria sp.]